MGNERKVILPPHCGACVFYNWDDELSACQHWHKINARDLIEEVAKMHVKGMSSEDIADSLFNGVQHDQDCQPYDNVCDHWAANSNEAYHIRIDEDKIIVANMRDEFVKQIEAIIDTMKGINRECWIR